MSRSADFLLIAAISAVVLSGCKKERSFRGANPGDEIVFGGTAGSASGFRSSKTKGGDGDSSVAGTFAVTGLDASNMESCVSYDSDADETYYFDWEDFEGGDALGGISSFGGSDVGNGLFGVKDSDVQTKTEYSGHKENVGGKNYERIDWVAGDKVRIFGDNILTSGGAPSEMVYKVTSPSIKPGDARRSSASLEKESVGTMGLRWGSGNADIYAFYPGNRPAKVFVSNTPSNFDVTVKLPKEQNTFTKTTSGNHTEIRPDMELAAMLAVSRDVPHASSVQLDFFPLVTTFRITLSNSLPNDDMKINKVSLVYSPSAPTPVSPLSGDYVVQYDKTSGSTLSSYFSGGLKEVKTSSITSPAQEISVNLGTDAVTLTRNNGNTLSVTLFAVPVQHKGIQLKVNLTKGGVQEERILWLEKKQPVPPAPAEQLEFEPYKKYDINVGVGNKWIYHLEATDISVAYSGGPGSSQLKSYKTDGATTKPAPWRVEGYSETGPIGPFLAISPAWLTGFPTNGNGVSYPIFFETVSAFVSTQIVISSPNTRTMSLRNKSEVGTQSEPIDLSKVPVGNSPFFSIDDGAGASTYAGNPMNTANCYVVTRPGWYKIPVVYGNAIKGTASEKERPNTAAYKPSGSGNNFLTDFIRHDGNTITKPWIKDNGINLDNGIAEPVWQDWPLLVQNIGFNRSNKDYIVFHVSKDNIHEGNAVIALKDNNGTIVWSWHIWVYGGNNLKTIRVRNNIGMSGGRPGQDNFNFLSENLGSCYDSGESVTFPAGNVWVKVSNDRKTAVIKISRNTGPSSFTTSPKYNNPYYQWGRKDPILPSDGTVANKNKVWFDWSGAMKTSKFSKHFWQTDGSASEANSEIANTIKYPMVPNKSSKMDNLYCNLWDSSCKEFCGFGVKKARFLPVTKSVYDPCPPGFCLPPNGSFTGFTRSGSTTWKLSEFNVSGSFDNGWHCRTVLKGESGGTTIFFPASGYLFINYEGVELGAAYWSGTPYDKGDGDILLFSSSHMVPGMEGAYRGDGFAVRPVAEN